MEPIEDFKVEHIGTKLPPWNVEGAIVDIVVDKENLTFCILINFLGIMAERTYESTENLFRFCETVQRRLLESLPPGWRVI